MAVPAMAALTSLNIAFNKIGAEGGVALRDALKTSNVKHLGIGKRFTAADGSHITMSQVQPGVSLALGGRVGELVAGPDSDGGVKLKWADDGSESDYTQLISLDGVPLNLPLQSEFTGDSLDLSRQQLDPGYALILAWWLTSTVGGAAVISLNCLGNPIGAHPVIHCL